MSWKKVIIITIAILSVVLLYLLPTPNTQYREVTIESKVENANLSVEEKTKKALEIIQGGGAPMEGIKLLLEVIQEDPNNAEALYYLGDFSMKTGQFEKAISRFEVLTKIQPKNDRFWYLLAQSYEMNKNEEQAIVAYQEFLKYGKDEIIIQTVQDKIKTLQQN